MPYRELFFDRPGDDDLGKKEDLRTALPKIDEMLRELFAASPAGKASLVEAGLGVDDTKFMTPFLVKTAAILFAAEGLFDGGAAYAAGTIGEALKLRALLASPAFTGTPTAPTAAPGTNTTQISTTAFVQATIAALVDSSPGTLDTLNELAAALGDDPNFATTMATALANRIRYDAAQSLSGPQSLQARQNIGMTEAGSALATAADAAAQAALIAQTGEVVGSLTFAWTAHTTGTAAMAGGADTIPQITDGTEITSLPYTPKSTTNKLRVTVTGALTSSVANNLWAAIFRDATANAKRATVVGVATAATITPFAMQFEETAGSISSTTFRVRVGNIVGADTWAVNGTASARRLGGSQALVIKIEEIKAS